jgi:hypothetical protein
LGVYWDNLARRERAKPRIRLRPNIGAEFGVYTMGSLKASVPSLLRGTALAGLCSDIQANVELVRKGDDINGQH